MLRVIKNVLAVLSVIGGIGLFTFGFIMFGGSTPKTTAPPPPASVDPAAALTNCQRYYRFYDADLQSWCDVKLFDAKYAHCPLRETPHIRQAPAPGCP